MSLLICMFVCQYVKYGASKLTTLVNSLSVACLVLAPTRDYVNFKSAGAPTLSTVAHASSYVRISYSEQNSFIVQHISVSCFIYFPQLFNKLS